MRFLLLFLLLITTGRLSYGQYLETVIQKGHELAVLSVAISSDSNYVATGSKDKSAKLWDVRSGREVRSFLGHESSVSCLEFSPDGQFLFTGSFDQTVRCWNVMTGKEVLSVQLPYQHYVTSLTIDPQHQYFIAAGYSSVHSDTAYVFDFKSGKILHKISTNPDQGLGEGVDVAISTDGNWIAFGEDNYTANVYSSKDWKMIYKFVKETGQCGGCGTKISFSPDSKMLYMGSNRGPVKKYSLSDGSLLKTYEEGPNDITDLQISGDGKKLLRATEKDILVWDENTGELLATLKAEPKRLFHQANFMLDSRSIIVASDNNTAFGWSIADKKSSFELTGLLNVRDQGGLNYDPNYYWESSIAKYIRFKSKLLITKDGKQLIKGKFGTKVKRWNISTGQTVMEYTGHSKAVLSYDLSKDGRFMLTGGGDGKVILWDVEKGDSVKVFHAHRQPIFDIKFSNDESLFATGSWDATMKVYDLNLGKRTQYWDFQNKSPYHVEFHPNDLYLFATLMDNSLEMYELDTRTSVRSFIGHTDIVSSLHVSADQRSLLSSSWDGSIRLWDIATGLMTKKLVGHRGAVHIAVFGPDQKYIYSAGADRSIKVWDLNTGKIILTIEGHQAEIVSLVFSPDGKMLISHSVDGVTKFWDLSTNKEFFEHIHLGERDWMAKTPDGYFNGTQEARKYIHFVSGMKTYSVDQFFEDFYRPELMPKLFQNRGGSKLQDLQGKINSSPPPTVKIATLASSDPNRRNLYIKVIDNGDGVESLRLFHNGKSIAVDKSELQLPSGKGKFTTYKHEVSLVAGTNVFSATAVNKSRVESEPASVEIESNIASRDSKCYILAVGINSYKNPRLNLNYAKPDAESFIDALKQNSESLFDKAELRTLFDDQASRDGILKSLEDLSAIIKPEDVFIFYYAGHGSMVDNRFFFIPSESARLYDLKALQNEALEASVLQEKFKDIKALKQLIIMDACQSGGSVELLATRGAAEEKAIAQLSRSAGIHVMASAGSEQFATEFTELGHGLFTYVLIRALRGAADGAPKDGKVTIYELKSYIDDQVPEMTHRLKGKPQYPYTFSRGQDFPIILQEK